MHRGLGEHVQDDLAQTVEPPVTEQVLGPPGGGGVQRSGGDDGVRQRCLLSVHVENRSDRHAETHLPGIVRRIRQFVDDGLLASDDAAEREPSNGQNLWMVFGEVAWLWRTFPRMIWKPMQV